MRKREDERLAQQRLAEQGAQTLCAQAERIPMTNQSDTHDQADTPTPNITYFPSANSQHARPLIPQTQYDSQISDSQISDSQISRTMRNGHDSNSRTRDRHDRPTPSLSPSAPPPSYSEVVENSNYHPPPEAPPEYESLF